MNRRALLTILLEADPRGAALYSTSPEFRATMDGIVSALPDLVTVAADRAVRAAAYREALQKAAESDPRPMRLTDIEWPEGP